MAEALAARDYTDRTRYDALMDVVKNRLTTRAFDSGYVMPREHYDMVLEAARHAVAENHDWFGPCRDRQHGAEGVRGR